MKKSYLLNSQKIAPYIFLLPFVLSLFFIYIFPVLKTILMSFQNVVPEQVEFIGFENYKKMFSPDFFQALSVSFRYTVYTIAILIPLPVFLAVLLNSGNKNINSLYRALFFLPSLVSVVVAGTVFRLIFASSERAVVNALLGLLGLKPVNWLLGGSFYAMFLMVAIATWRWTGVNIIYFMSGLQEIPEELYEAGSIDGMNGFQKFLYITIPLLKPTIVFVTIISIFGGFSMFEESYIFWSGQSPNNVGLTMVGLIYKKGFQTGNIGMASAIGLVLLLIVFIVSVFSLYLFGFFRKEE